MSDDSTTKQDLLIIGVAIAAAVLLVSASNFLQPVMPTYGIGSCCGKDCIPAREFPWWCGE